MRCQTLAKIDDHVWYAFGQDPGKHDKITDSNQIVLSSGGETVLLDPGGMEVFPNFLTALSEKVSIDSIKHIFLSHQDPDICSSLLLWREVCPNDVNIYVPWMWQDFITHFDVDAVTTPVPDEGMSIKLASGRILEMIPAHYLHSPGNLNLYDPTAKLLFSGEIGSALIPGNTSDSFFVKNFETHVQYMEEFHNRWMASADARDAWITQIRRLKVDVMAPQRGLAFKDDDIESFLNWFSEAELGGGISVICDETTERSTAPKIEKPNIAQLKPEAPKPEPVKSTPPPAPAEPVEPDGPFPAEQSELVQSTSKEDVNIKEDATDSAPKPGNEDGTLVIKTDAPLFARLGGDPAIDIVVDSLFSRVVDDPRISRFFGDVDIDVLKKSQKAYMAAAFGGPISYAGKSLKDAHAHLVADGLDASHFDVVAQHLLSVMKDFQVDADMIEEAMQIVESTKSEIVG
jgi:truncated hemoglobin YjbI